MRLLFAVRFFQDEVHHEGTNRLWNASAFVVEAEFIRGRAGRTGLQSGNKGRALHSSDSSRLLVVGMLEDSGILLCHLFFEVGIWGMHSECHQIYLLSPNSAWKMLWHKRNDTAVCSRVLSRWSAPWRYYSVFEMPVHLCSKPNSFVEGLEGQACHFRNHKGATSSKKLWGCCLDFWSGYLRAQNSGSNFCWKTQDPDSWFIYSMHEASNQFERNYIALPTCWRNVPAEKDRGFAYDPQLTVIQFEVSQLASSKGKPVEVAHLTHSSSSRNPSWATDTWHLRVTKRHLYCSNTSELQARAVYQRDFRCIQNVLKHHQYLERWCSTSPRSNLGSCHCEYGSFIIFKQSF